MKIELANCTAILLAEIADPGFDRDSVAQTYAFAMLSSEPTDWGAVNWAILARWSINALNYIKTRAHKLVEAKRREAAT